jgi:outer membrane protein assembly factor BamB
LAEQASASFSPLPSQRGGATLQPVRHRFNRPDEEVMGVIVPVCGPAPDLNSLGCYNLPSGESLADLPLPGQLTTTPQFYDGSWFVGTSRGFLMRMDATGVFMTPGFGIDSLFFHGPDSRYVMKLLSAATTSSGSAGGATPAAMTQSLKANFRSSWTWYATANAEFIGTPQFGGGRVFALTANQSVNAFDLQTGKLAWGVRLAPDAQLRLDSTSLIWHERGLLVGTSDGNLMSLDPKNGQTIFRHSVMSGSGDRFSAIAAPVLPLPDGIVVANAESVTQKLSWETRGIDWSYGVGSVVQPKFDDGFVFIAGSDGAVHKLDARTGQLRWRRTLPVSSPLIALTLLRKQNIVLAASANGSIFALRISDGLLEGEGQPSTYGPVIGDFFSGRNELNEVCLSYRTPGIKCWTWNSELNVEARLSLNDD